MEHRYALALEWLGNLGTGTSDYRAYSRRNALTAPGKLHDIAGSADRTFHGDAERWNPEELLLAALSQCHMLSYLHVAVQHGIVVSAYRDAPVGVLTQEGQGGRFTSATLRPVVTISEGDPAIADELHAEASRLCFIANSVAFPIRHEATTLTA
ncbi:MAG TPA: OsmC family protein [Microbacteriaceae bacterium]|nr:OsmC family protein [Microbacteriaceae bacterium]